MAKQHCGRLPDYMAKVSTRPDVVRWEQRGLKAGKQGGCGNKQTGQTDDNKGKPLPGIPGKKCLDCQIEKEQNREKCRYAEKGKKIMGHVKAKGAAPVFHRLLENRRIISDKRQRVPEQGQKQKQGDSKKSQGKHFPAEMMLIFFTAC
jgi:hypothetical protein